MGSRTAVVTKQNWQVAFVAACLVLLSVSAAGCVVGSDDDSLVLAIDPEWDLSPGSTPLCRLAGVDSMSWELRDSRGNSIRKVERDKCLALDFVGLVPGRYELEITGYDRDEVPRWKGTCDDLDLGRFDVIYVCPVDQVEVDDSGEDEDDAGVADGG
jgi:hypothetical protein